MEFAARTVEHWHRVCIVTRHVRDRPDPLRRGPGPDRLSRILVNSIVVHWHAYSKMYRTVLIHTGTWDGPRCAKFLPAPKRAGRAGGPAFTIVRRPAGLP